MRSEFVDGLIARAEADERVFLLTADLGFGSLEKFADRFPDRFLNVGVAEQNMVAVATGLAQEGFHPYCYSIATFAIARTWEFLRNGPVAHGLTMGIVGVGPGFDYGADGHTHHAVEDVGLVRLLPGANVIAPCDAASARLVADTVLEDGSLTYFRIARNGPPCPVAKLGEGARAPKSEGVISVALGEMWPVALEVQAALNRQGFSMEVAVVEKLGSRRAEESLGELAEYDRIVTIESHLVRGGLASAVTERLGSLGWSGRLLPVGMNELATGVLGSTEYLWNRHTMHVQDISQWCVSA